MLMSSIILKISKHDTSQIMYMTLHATNSVNLCGNCLRVAVKWGPSTLRSLVVVFLLFFLFFFEDRRLSCLLPCVHVHPWAQS